MAFDTYITFPEQTGIKGEAGSKDAKEAASTGKPIQLQSFGFGSAMATTQARSDVGGATTGRGKFNPFTGEANLDTAGASFAYHAAAGTVFKEVHVHMFLSVNSENSGDQKSLNVIHLRLTDVVISSYTVSVGGGDDLPTMSFELNVGGMFFKYTPLDPKTKTSLQSANAKFFGWSILTNQELTA
jgi:type VI protein secretion system component Hcp